MRQLFGNHSIYQPSLYQYKFARCFIPPNTASHRSVRCAIRSLEGLDCFQWLVDNLVANRCGGYSREIQQLQTHKQTHIITKYFHSVTQFLESYSKHFELSKSKKLVRLKFSPDFELSSASVVATLRLVLPFWGSVKLESLAALLNDSKIQDVYSFLHDEKVQEQYVPIKNSHGKVFVYSKANSDIVSKGFSVGDNRSIISMLSAAELLMRTVPSYFVPFEDCAKNLPEKDLKNVRLVSIRRISMILGGDLECAYFKGWEDMFLRRLVQTNLYDLPKCEFNYQGYDVRACRAIKLAFCLPSTPTPVADVQANLFPSLVQWGKSSSAYSPFDVIGMFPGVMLALPNGKVHSLVREKYPELSPDIERQLTENEESIFEEKLRSIKYAAALAKLLDLTSQQSNFTIDDLNVRCDRRRDGTVFLTSREAPSFTDQEIMDIVSRRLGEHDAYPLEELTAMIREKTCEKDQKKFREAVYSRYNGSLVKLIRKNPKYNIILTQERKPDSHIFHYIIKRGSGYEKKEENSFLDEKKLLDEVTFQIKHRSRSVRESHHGVAIVAVQSCLPEDARRALKKLGGMLQFLACFPKVFQVSSEKYVKML